MRHSTRAVSIVAAAVLATSAVPAHAEIPEIDVSPDGARTAQPGAQANFTGAVQSKPLFDTTDYSDMSGGQVSFHPGARTAWHSHPAGQTLIVTEGAGWVQSWGESRQRIDEGDVVRIPPGVKHWHGATATDEMTHIAIAQAVDGNRVTWMEHVTDDQYLS